jgi:biotin-(acetyl-CoA carboxylase) ligase
LCEALAQGERWAVVVGIGINVGTRAFGGELAKTATSLAMEGVTAEIEGVARAFLGRLGDCAQLPLEELVRRVRARDWLCGRAVAFADGRVVVAGIAAGIGDGGELLIRTEKETIALERGTLVRVD